MAVRRTIVGIGSPRELEDALRAAYYLADEELATAAYLALALGKPLLLEGAPGVGKTEAAKAIAGVLGRTLLRLQCYEGIDAAAALYEWNFPRQMLAMRQEAPAGGHIDIYKDEFLIERPMLACLRRPEETMLLIDEIDRSDQEFEAFLLEFLSDFQISIPERGAIRAYERPVVILTSNRTRELHEALRRRCVYHWIEYPSPEREMRIVMMRASGVGERRGARGRRRRRTTAPRAAGEASRHRRDRRMGRGGDLAQRAGRALAGCVPPLARRRAQGRGRLRACRAEDRRHSRRGAGMSDTARTIAPFLAFAALLRRSGFAVAPEQTMAWLAAIELFGPTGIGDIRRSAHATLAPPPERFAEFDALFNAHFLGALVPGWKRRRAKRSRRAPPKIPRAARSRFSAKRHDESGAKATGAERLSARRFAPGSEDETLRRFARDLPARVPRRRGYRWRAARGGAERRCAADVSRGHAQRRRVHPHAPPPAPAAAAPHRPAHRRLRLDEGAHRGASRLRPCAGPRRRPRSRSSPSARGSPASPGRCG